MPNKSFNHIATKPISQKFDILPLMKAHEKRKRQVSFFSPHVSPCEGTSRSKSYRHGPSDLPGLAGCSRVSPPVTSLTSFNPNIHQPPAGPHQSLSRFCASSYKASALFICIVCAPYVVCVASLSLCVPSLLPLVSPRSAAQHHTDSRRH